jgi:hypothetical protein
MSAELKDCWILGILKFNSVLPQLFDYYRLTHIKCYQLFCVNVTCTHATLREEQKFNVLNLKSAKRDEYSE